MRKSLVQTAAAFLFLIATSMGCTADPSIVEINGKIFLRLDSGEIQRNILLPDFQPQTNVTYQAVQLAGDISHGEVLIRRTQADSVCRKVSLIYAPYGLTIVARSFGLTTYGDCTRSGHFYQEYLFEKKDSVMIALYRGNKQSLDGQVTLIFWNPLEGIKLHAVLEVDSRIEKIEYQKQAGRLMVTVCLKYEGCQIFEYQL